ncbi:MAG: peptidylprolyl isomerase [Clostridia bacterium]|nr:peptidylprolyl isomerase [Clostridia bacterium]
MGKKLQIVIWLVIAIAAFLLLGGCVYNFARAISEDVVHPEVTFEIENLGTIKMELYQEYAPNTVANIVKLVEKGYYTDKVLFGKDDAILYFGLQEDGKEEIPQASFINPEITKDSDDDFKYSITGEFAANDFNKNTLCHEKGVVSLLRNNYGSAFTKESYNSGVAKLGIVMKDTVASLNGYYTAFAKITEGLELLENVYNTQETVAPQINEETGEPIETGIDEFSNKLIIKSATVDTHGIDMGIPKMIEYFDYDEYLYQMINSQYAG